MREIIKLVIVLSIICAVSAATLTATKLKLESKIEKQQDLYIRGPALERLFNRPAGELLDNKVMFNVEKQTFPVFYLKENGEITGLALEASGSGGYGGDINIIIGIDLKTELMVGMEIIEHKETPGVGSRVEGTKFRKQWINISLKDDVALKSQGGNIDAISGATYSSKAVVNGTNIIINLLKKHRDEIIALIKAENKQA